MKRILAIATGGTIASTNTPDGLAPTLSGSQIASLVPGASQIADIEVVQPMNLDSTNLEPSHWLEIASTIEDAYSEYDGFVIFHGTDTLAYTAAGLSYIVQNSTKPIVITGSQKPIEDPYTDAKTNVRDSLLYACDDASQGVSVVFAGMVIEGTRARKVRTVSPRAFESIGYPPKAQVVDGEIVRNFAEPPFESGVRFSKKLGKNVLCCRMTPGADPIMLEKLADDYEAILIEGFGLGGIPEYPGRSFKKAILEWTEAGKLVVLTTQAPLEGSDYSRYEVGSSYVGHPSIATAGDMTFEACFAKALWACGQACDAAGAKELFITPLGADRLKD